MATGGMNASSTSPDTSGYSGPAPTFGGGPFLSPTGGGTPPSMTATPPTNPNPAPPSPQPAVMPATGPAPTPVMPPYGEHRRPDFGGSMDWAQGMMPQRGGFRGFDPSAGFGFLRSNRGPATPTWSQQGGVYNYNPNGRPEGMANPMIGNMMDRFGQKQQMLMDRVAQQRQMIAERLPQTAAGAPTMGLGAINPFKPQG